MSEKKEIAFLDRPIIGDRIAWWKVIYALLILFVVFTRLWALAPRGYSHDESIHAWESWKLITGQGYSHDPTYHGPFLYHFTAFIFGLFGHNDYTARLSPALFGIALAVLPLLLKKWLGKKGVPAATFLIAISPVMMHRSRFLRHDVYVAVFNLLLFISSLRYLDQRKTKDLYLVAAATSLGFCAKETTFITYFIFGTFLALLFLSQWLRDRTRPWRELPVFDLIIVMGTLILPLASPFLIRVLGGDPLDYTQQGILFSGAIFLVVLGISAAIGFWWDWRRWLVCAGIFYGIFVPLFTTMFTNGRGFATGTVGQLGYWLSQQGVRRGDQPPYYYLVLMPMYEFLPLLGAIGGGIYFFSKESREDEEAVEDAPTGIPFIPMLLYWSVLAFVIYSWAGEKMPWLTMHLALPLQLLAGWAIGRLFDADWGELREKGALWLLLLIPLFIYVILRLLNLNPSAGTTRQELSETMAWLTSLLVGLGLVVAISRILYRLSGGQRWRIGLVSLFIILSMLTVRFAWMASFVNADLPTEFLVYAQGTPDVALVAKEIEEMSRRLTGGLHMKVAYDDDSSWPFVWYLRKFDNAQFYGQEPAGPFDAEVVLVGPPNESAVKPLLGNDYYRRQYRLIWWPNQDWYMSPELKSIRQGMKEKRIAGKLSDLLLYLKTMLKKIWRVVRDKSARQNLWDVFFYREYEASLTSWPHVHKFALYVRRDVAQQLWDYGPEVLTAAEPLPGDEYVEKWEQIMATDAFGSSGSGPGQLNRPKGIGVDEDGNVYVADTHNHRIQVFDGDGQFLRQWGAEGNQSGQFKEPWGVTVGPEGDIYIADTWNHRIQVFDVRGQLKRVWGTFGEVKDPMGSGDLLYGPRDLVVDAEGNLYVTDTGNKRVIKYDAEGNMIKAVGGAGSEEGQMQEPVGLALSPEGDLYVADTWNQRIQVFDKDLDFLRSWPVYAWEGMSVLNKPYLAVDAEGNVYATDPEGYRVLAFDSQGELLRVWGQKGGALSSMNLPTGVAVDPSGRLLISDSENGRLLVFEEH